MLIKEKRLPAGKGRLLVSFDLEWTKNYKIKNGNRPFCFSFVYFQLEDVPRNIEALRFGFCSYYVETEEEGVELARLADVELGKHITGNNMILGHQLSSDISVLINFAPPTHTRNFVRLRDLWHNRKGDQTSPMVFDSRYDIDSLLKQKSRRLVDVCSELNMDVTQPELKGSMTKMQNSYLLEGNSLSMEMLSVLNLRHSLSAAILYFYYMKGWTNPEPMNINRIIHKNLGEHYAYVRSDEFRDLLKDG